MGPKPSVTLKLYYTPGQRYAVTLLGNTALNGPWTAPADYRERMGSRKAWEAFRNYPTPEGYYFLGYFQEYPGDADAEFVWGYYPPNKLSLIHILHWTTRARSLWARAWKSWPMAAPP